jgi:Tfp pilus assembly protein PilF
VKKKQRKKIQGSRDSEIQRSRDQEIKGSNDQEIKGSRNSAGLVILLVVLCCIAYSNSFHVPFHFDDLRLIRFNFSLRDLADWKGIISSEPFRPLLVATFALNFKIGKSDPFSYHILNLSFHILAVLLFFLFMRRISKNVLLSFGAAALMAIHPLNTESVTYISSRSIVLCAVFYFSSLLSFDLYVEKQKREWLFLFCLFFFLAMITKEEGALIPFVALLYNFLLKGPDSVRLHKWMHIATCSFVFLLGVLRMILFFKFAQELPYPYFTWIATQLNMWLRYLWFAIVPVSLNVDPDIPSITFANLKLWICAICIAGLLLLCIKLRRNYSLLSFWGIWFFVNLIVSSAVPLADFYADHRVYISLFGFCACVAYLVHLLTEKFRSADFALRISFGLLIILFTFATYKRNETWKSELNLWSDAAQKSPQKIRTHLNLAGSYFNSKQYDLAIQEYQFVRSLNPANPQIYAGLGISYLRKRELDLAEPAFKKALELDPNLIDAKTGLGIIRYTQNRYAEALDYFRQVYPYRRESIQLVDLMSYCSIQVGNFPEAILVLEPSLNLEGARPVFYQRLADAYEKTGRTQEAQILRQQYTAKFGR